MTSKSILIGDSQKYPALYEEAKLFCSYEPLQVPSMESLRDLREAPGEFLIYSPIEKVSIGSLKSIIKLKFPNTSVEVIKASHEDLIEVMLPAQEDLSTEGTDSNNSKEKAHKVLALVATQGAVGTTSITTLLAGAMQSHERSIGILSINDAFINAFPSLSKLAVSLPERLDLDHLDQYEVRLGGRAYCYRFFEKPEELELIEEHIPHIIETLKTRHEVLLIDAGNTWNESMVCALKAADRVILMGEERAGCEQSLVSGLDLLHRLGIERSRIYCLINKSLRKQRDYTFVSSLSLKLNTPNIISIPHAGNDFEEFNSYGILLDVLEEDTRFSYAIKTYAHDLLLELGIQSDTPEQKQTNKRSLFGLLGG
ncbi:MAG: hypothetical protein Q4E22_05460 [Coriobacteriia bacterium]|nr:hypothetical protein [Coriobacteriia bacterium]